MYKISGLVFNICSKKSNNFVQFKCKSCRNLLALHRVKFDFVQRTLHFPTLSESEENCLRTERSRGRMGLISDGLPSERLLTYSDTGQLLEILFSQERQPFWTNPDLLCKYYGIPFTSETGSVILGSWWNVQKLMIYLDVGQKTQSEFNLYAALDRKWSCICICMPLWTGSCPAFVFVFVFVFVCLSGQVVA